ncbi:unnamed protein product [Heterobilharzia americana]|nr:unnamed protein product [Heterobilharzia americana]
MTRSSRKIHSSSSIKCDGASVYNHSVKSPPPTALSSETSIACDSLINIVDLSRCASQIRNQAKDTKLNTVDMLHGDEIKTNNFREYVKPFNEKNVITCTSSDASDHLCVYSDSNQLTQLSKFNRDEYHGKSSCLSEKYRVPIINRLKRRSNSLPDYKADFEKENYFELNCKQDTNGRDRTVSDGTSRSNSDSNSEKLCADDFNLSSVNESFKSTVIIGEVAYEKKNTQTSVKTEVDENHDSYDSNEATDEKPNIEVSNGSNMKQEHESQESDCQLAYPDNIFGDTQNHSDKTCSDTGENDVSKTDEQPTMDATSTEDKRTNLIINYLPQDMSHKEVMELFEAIGKIDSFKLMCERNTGQHMGYAFVNYVHPKDAEEAIGKLNGLHLQNKIIKVSYARPRSESIKGANLYVSGLSKSMSQQQLEELFSSCGKIISSRILHDSNTGISRGVGFVRFDQRTEAEKAIKQFNGVTPPGAADPITVKLACSPSSLSTILSSITNRLKNHNNDVLCSSENSLPTRDPRIKYMNNLRKALIAHLVNPAPASKYLTKSDKDELNLMIPNQLRARSENRPNVTRSVSVRFPNNLQCLNRSPYHPVCTNSIETIRPSNGNYLLNNPQNQNIHQHQTSLNHPYHTHNSDQNQSSEHQHYYMQNPQSQPILLQQALTTPAVLPTQLTPQPQLLSVLPNHQTPAILYPSLVFPAPAAYPNFAGSVSGIPQHSYMQTFGCMTTPSAGYNGTIPIESCNSGITYPFAPGMVAPVVTPRTTQATGFSSQTQINNSVFIPPLSSLPHAFPTNASTRYATSALPQSSDPNGLGGSIWCVMVSNLPPDIEEISLRHLFSPFGTVLSIQIVRDAGSNYCKGYGFVLMVNYAEAIKAVINLNGCVVEAVHCKYRLDFPDS